MHISIVLEMTKPGESSGLQNTITSTSIESTISTEQKNAEGRATTKDSEAVTPSNPTTIKAGKTQ